MTSDARSPTHATNIRLPDASVTSNPQSLSVAVHARQSDYTYSEKIRVKIGSWNIAGCLGTENDLGAWFVQENNLSTKFSGRDQNEYANAQYVTSKTGDGGIPLSGTKSGSFFDAEDMDIYVLGLQEVVGLNNPRQLIGKVHPDLGLNVKWRKALVDALPEGYVQIEERQSSGLLLFIYASPSIAPIISSVNSVCVGTGMMGYLANKGAIATRILLGETTRIVFINSHLASGADPINLERRCWDVNQILQRVTFEPVVRSEFPTDSQERIGDEDFGFWFGDLNFRIDGVPGDEIRRLLTLHVKGEYSVEQLGDSPYEEIEEDKNFIIHNESDDEYESNVPKSNVGIKSIKRTDQTPPTLLESNNFPQLLSEDPASLQAILDSLLPHDQLKLAQKQMKAFHDGWREGQISFLPTYKYDIGGEGAFDTSEKKRAPSWCDRVLYRTRRDKLAHEEQLKSNLATQLDEDAEDDGDFLFDYIPDEDGLEDHAFNNYGLVEYGENDQCDQVIRQKKINIEMYQSHQWVPSSDHKPLSAAFTLEYDLIIPELKAKVQQEVARDLDRAENERRPGVTVIIDYPTDHSVTDSPQEAIDAVDFGNIAYNQKKTRYLTIANTSLVPATVAFVDKCGSGGAGGTNVSSWLSVYFIDPEANQNDGVSKVTKESVTLEPGFSIHAVIEVWVEDIMLVRTLNEAASTLDDVLILRVTDGRDHFIPVRGSWLQSCLGRSIDQLIRIPVGGVRALHRRNSCDQKETRDQFVHWSTPRELFKLTEAIHILTERVIADSNILEGFEIPQDAPGWPFDSKHWVFKDPRKREAQKSLVFEALDNDKGLVEVFSPDTSALEKLEIVSEVLLVFLSTLQDGIITTPLWATLEQSYPDRGSSSEEIKAWVMDILSTAPNHNISFVFLTSMLARMVVELSPLSKTTNPKDKTSIDFILRKNFNWKMRGPLAKPPDSTLIRRTLVEKAMTDIFVTVLFRDIEGLKEQEKKNNQEKRKIILQEFLKVTSPRNG